MATLVSTKRDQFERVHFLGCLIAHLLKYDHIRVPPVMSELATDAEVDIYDIGDTFWSSRSRRNEVRIKIIGGGILHLIPRTKAKTDSIYWDTWITGPKRARKRIVHLRADIEPLAQFHLLEGPPK